MTNNAKLERGVWPVIKGRKGKSSFSHRRVRCNQERGKPQQERWGAAAIKVFRPTDALWGGKCMAQVRNHIILMSFYYLKSPPASYKCMQNTELLFGWLVFGLVLWVCFCCCCFNSKTKERRRRKALFALCLEDQNGSCCRDGWSHFYQWESSSAPITLASQCSWGAISTGVSNY